MHLDKAKGGARESTPATLFNARDVHALGICMEMRGRTKNHIFLRGYKRSREALGEEEKRHRLSTRSPEKTLELKLKLV